ncbi:protein DpdD [Microvirga alba]|uniref:Uncharacterized protein n=1 Tax=Microvirga alba TaxID=2791025 RepID=A0A931BSC2_9HYPH|nr:protein DpdD [Microvirga alba]MBF9235123.1 hypothetical protein [Microvirga alba]
MAVALDTSTLARLARWAELNSAALKLAHTLEDERFPGAIVPAVRADGTVAFYALADSAAAWRRLQPLLVAFAGATFTDFEGVPSGLDTNDPLERFISDAYLHAVALLRPGNFRRATGVVKALLSLQDAISRAPDLVTARPEPTSVLLARLQDALNAGDLDAAWAVNGTLRDELRLDAQNLLQLEFQIRAASGDWSGIHTHPDFELLCASGPSPATAELLLEALYWTHFASRTAEGGEALDEGVESLGRSLLKFVGRTPSPSVEKMMVLLAPYDAPEKVDADDVAQASKGREEAGSRSTDRSGHLDALARARTALFAVAAGEGNVNIQIDAEAVTAIGLLSEAKRQELMSRPIFRAVWSEIEGRLGPKRPPEDWLGWLSRLDDLDFDAASYARRAASEWRLLNLDIDPYMFTTLARNIDEVPDGLAGDRLNQSLPYLVEWAAADPWWPRTGLCPVYLSLLMRIALSTRRGETTIKSAVVLLESALRCGVSPAEYRDAMEAVAVIAAEALNRNTAYDVFELADVANSFTPVDAAALTDATAAVVTAALGLMDRLSAGQQLACSRLASLIGWKPDAPAVAPKATAPIAEKLSNLTIGVYTLTETAGRNAQSVLASIEPDIKVELNHDHDATAALAALVARADLFVIAWASAKHAATNFIKARRGSKPLVYAPGKGASSLIRAIEDYVLNPNPLP